MYVQTAENTLMTKLRFFASLLFPFLLSNQAIADEASVKKAVEQKLNTTVEKVTKTPYLGLYEVFASGQILYTDENITAILAGPLLDAKSMKNVTAERMKILTAVKINDLPLDLAVKTVRGNGSRTLVSFEDPNCGYCKSIAKDFSKLDNVTIYTFVYPILSEDSKDKARKVWCAADRSKAWNSLMLDGTQISGDASCDVPIQQVLALGRKLSVTGTPTLVFEDGERVPGAIGHADIEARLSRGKSASRLPNVAGK